MTWMLLALTIADPPPPPATPVAAVTALISGKKMKYGDSLNTLWEGLALALVGSSEAVTELKAEEWKAAVKKNHLLVSYPKPHAIKGTGAVGGKTYAVNEILIRIADSGVIKGLWVRCGATYHAFDKYNSALALFIEEARYLRSSNPTRHVPCPSLAVSSVDSWLLAIAALMLGGLGWATRARCGSRTSNGRRPRTPPGPRKLSMPGEGTPTNHFAPSATGRPGGRACPEDSRPFPITRPCIRHSRDG